MRFQNKMRMVLDTDKKFGARVMTARTTDSLEIKYPEIKII